MTDGGNNFTLRMYIAYKLKDTLVASKFIGCPAARDDDTIQGIGFGRFLDTDGDPKVQPREEGLRAINPTHEVVWTVSLAAGEARTVRYSYQALIPQTRERYSCSW